MKTKKDHQKDINKKSESESKYIARNKKQKLSEFGFFITWPTVSVAKAQPEEPKPEKLFDAEETSSGKVFHEKQCTKF